MRDDRIEELLGREDVQWIDVRSPSEYAESTIPGSINVPLFTDAERAQVGTMYKQESVETARSLGLTLFGAKLSSLVEEVQAVSGERTAAVFCWRGGMRSKSVASLLELMGVPVVRLQDGYRAYRQYITEKLSELTPASLPTLLVIHGMTGVGKTMLLHKLQEQGLPVLDLEGFARHRGSVFGGIGLDPANQRQFDSLLWDALYRLRAAPMLLVEAESKRIGRVSMPDGLHDAKLAGINIEVTASLPVRVERTLLQYKLDDQEVFAAEITHALGRIEKRFSPDLRKRCFAHLEARDYKALFAALLAEYYDPRYQHAMLQYERPFLKVDAEHLDDAVEEIKRIARTIG